MNEKEYNDLDRMLEELKAGTIGINLDSETSESHDGRNLGGRDSGNPDSDGHESGNSDSDSHDSGQLDSDGQGSGSPDSDGRDSGNPDSNGHNSDSDASGQRRKRRRRGRDTDSKKSGKDAGEEEPFSWKKEILSWLEVLVTAAVIAFIIDHVIIANSKVPTGSMISTIMPGDRVIGSRLNYKFGDPERGDIAIFIYPDDKAKGITTYYVKRIIGMPGDTIDIIDGRIYLNGSDTPLEESYIREPMDPEPPQHYEVPEDSYFMMGDNRNYSNDSRRWENKYVPRKDLIAEVLFQYFPKIKKLD